MAGTDFMHELKHQHELIDLEINPGERLDQALLRNLSTRLVPRRELKAILNQSTSDTGVFYGRNKIKGSTVLNSGEKTKAFRLRVSTNIYAQSPETSKAHTFFNEDSKRFLLYEDGDFLILNKPAGLPSAPIGKKPGLSAVDLALHLVPDLKKRFPGSPECGLLHRLDGETTGVLAFSKNPRSFVALRKNWNALTTKIYRARVSHPPGDTPITITTPIGHSPKNDRKMIAVLGPRYKVRGKSLQAVTVIQKIYKNGDLEILIETGVMHQIRVHLQSIGSPIKGDRLYGGEPAPGLYLHAESIEIRPPGKASFRVTCPPPDYW